MVWAKDKKFNKMLLIKNNNLLKENIRIKRENNSLKNNSFDEKITKLKPNLKIILKNAMENNRKGQ